jgi:hypothetical protein
MVFWVEDTATKVEISWQGVLRGAETEHEGGDDSDTIICMYGSFYNRSYRGIVFSYRNCNALSKRMREAMEEGMSVARKQKNMLTPITTR